MSFGKRGATHPVKARCLSQDTVSARLGQTGKCGIRDGPRDRTDRAGIWRTVGSFDESDWTGSRAPAYLQGLTGRMIRRLHSKPRSSAVSLASPKMQEEGGRDGVLLTAMGFQTGPNQGADRASERQDARGAQGHRGLWGQAAPLFLLLRRI